MLDLRLYANDLVGRRFKTQISASGFTGEVHVWNKVREFTIEKVYEHHVLCIHVCDDTGNTYRESFTAADLETYGVIKDIWRARSC